MAVKERWSGRLSRTTLILAIGGTMLVGTVRAQPPGQSGEHGQPESRSLAEVVGPPEFVAELRDRGNDGVVRIFLDNSGQDTMIKVIPRGSGICAAANEDCAGELVFAAAGRPLQANEKVVITGVSDEQCFVKNVFEITAENNPVPTGPPQNCGKGDVWMYMIEFMIDGEVVGEPIDPGVLIDGGRGG